MAVEDAAERNTLRGDVPIIDISCVGVGSSSVVVAVVAEDCVCVVGVD